MNVRKNVMLLSLAASALLGVQPIVSAAPNLPCWMQQIQERDGKIHVQFLPEYRGRAFISTEARQRNDQTVSNPALEPLVMREGEAAVASDGLHSGCEMRVERRDGRLGLRIKTYVSLPGLPYDERTAFIPATRPDGDDMQK